jgi:hypothetical protein
VVSSWHAPPTISSARTRQCYASLPFSHNSPYLRKAPSSRVMLLLPPLLLLVLVLPLPSMMSPLLR